MPVMNFDLEDGLPPVSFTLRPEDAERFMAFMAECQAAKEIGALTESPNDELTDEQISAGAAILCDCRKPKPVGRNAAIDVFHAMVDAKSTATSSGEVPAAKNLRIAITEPMILVIRFRADGAIADVSQETESGKVVRIFALGQQADLLNADKDAIIEQARQAFVKRMNGLYQGSPTNHPKWPDFRDGFAAAKESEQ